ncbi:MAG: SHOCT domain-containing protein [Dehalococcoidia bacterium]|nr:SHOCT domain-containing protein [Dehalococcoidia bacterium]MDZ4247485.1 SHOCT domain-containing protein [Dehalococcoidia bacterium]
MGYWFDGMGWWIMFGGLWMILFWGGLILLIVWAIKKIARIGESGPGAAGKSSPVDIARERYARGDISREEFEQIKRDLS